MGVGAKNCTYIKTGISVCGIKGKEERKKSRFCPKHHTDA